MKIDVKGCQRCGEDHPQLLFSQLVNAIDEWQWWAPCPNGFGPVLLKIEDDEPNANSVADQLLNTRDFLSRLQHAIRPGMSPDDCLSLLAEATAVLQETKRVLPKVDVVAKPPTPPDKSLAEIENLLSAANQKAAAARRECLRLTRENISLRREVDDLRALLAGADEGGDATAGGRAAGGVSMFGV